MLALGGERELGACPYSTSTGGTGGTCVPPSVPCKLAELPSCPVGCQGHHSCSPGPDVEAAHHGCEPSAGHLMHAYPVHPVPSKCVCVLDA